MITLTPDQRAAMLKLGDHRYESAVIPNDVLEQLIALGLVYKRPHDGRLDFTDLGHYTYDATFGRKK